MTFLPVVQRELQVSARRPHLCWLRLTAALAAAGVAGGVLLVEDQMGGIASSLMATTLGARLFSLLTHAAFIGCAFAGPLLTADCISAERREDTLGLLFLTDLRGYDIALGKLAGRSLVAGQCLLAVVPVAALPLLWGGVSMAEFVRVAVVLLNTLGLSLTAGLLVSSFFRDRQTAGMATEAVLLVLVLAGPVVGTIAGPGPGVFSAAVLAQMTSPWQLFRWAFELKAGGVVPWFLPALALQGLLALSLLALASWRLPRCWQTGPPRRVGLDWSAAWHWWKFGGPARRSVRRRRLLEPNPLCWLGCRDLTTGRLMWVLVFVTLDFALLMNLGGSPWGQTDTAVGPLFFAHATLKLVVASDAASRFDQLRRSGMLPLIWSTRLSAAEIVEGQMQSMKRLFRGPALAILAYDLLWLVMSLRDRVNTSSALSLACAVCVSGISLWDLWTLARVGLWHGLKCRRPGNAAYLAMFKILGVPWLGVMPAAFVPGEASLTEVLLLWTLFSVVANTVFPAMAAGAFRREFPRLMRDPVAEGSRLLPSSG